MTYSEIQPYLHHGWTITRLAWGDPSVYLRKVGEGKTAVAQASSPKLRLTRADMDASDWVPLAQVN